MKVEEVISMALSEQGLEYSPEVVEGWLRHDNPPAELGPIIDAMVVDIDYLMRVVQARMLASPDISEPALRKMAGLPRMKRRQIAGDSYRKAMGYEKFHVVIAIPRHIKEAISEMARAMNVSRSGFVSQWLSNCVQDVLSRTAEVEGLPEKEAYMSRKHQRGRARPIVYETIRRIQKLKQTD